MVIELEFDEPIPSRFKFESMCIIFSGLIESKSSLGDSRLKLIEFLSDAPLFLYSGKYSVKSTPFGRLKIATAMRQSKALLD